MIRLCFILLLFPLTLAVACQTGNEVVVSDPNLSVDNFLPQLQKAKVEAIEINQTTGPPIEVSITARGHLDNQCGTIDNITQQKSSSDFYIIIQSRYRVSNSCEDTPVPFEETVALDVIGLPAGIYLVDVNGLKGSFKLQRENLLDPENAVVSGVVWSDSCPTDEEDLDSHATLSVRCKLRDDGSITGNGVLDDDEVGIGGIIVNLGDGDCPTTGLATTITDGFGVFLFSGLKSGNYCVSINGSDKQNALQLRNGSWTSPVADVLATRTIELQSGESIGDANFGWQNRQDRLQLPREDPCTDKALFIKDVTIPDDTTLHAGETFTKTWRLRNIGSCIWKEGYSVVFSEGNRMDGPDLVPMPSDVLPGDDVDISVPLTAPLESGTYRGAWQLNSQEDNRFGIGPGSNKAFWVQIVVEE